MGPTVIAVGGGKGGTGKSVLSANLGIAFARLGMRTVIVDADLGAPNQHTMFGIDRPGVTLQALVDRRIKTLDEACLPTRTPRLFLVPGAGAVVGAANITHAQKQKLLRHARNLDTEVVVIDVGAGVSYNALDSFDAGDLRLVAVTPQLTSVQNAYCFLKGAVYRELRAGVGDKAAQALWDESTARASETERVRDVVARVRSSHPAVAVRLEQMLRRFGAGLVGNMVEAKGGERVLHAFARMVHDFLGIELPLLGQLPMSRRIHDSVTRRTPLMEARPDDELSLHFTTLAERLLSLPTTSRHEENVEADDEPGAIPSTPEDPRWIDACLSPFARREERIAVRWPVRIRADDRFGDGHMIDCSPHGSLVSSEMKVANGERVEVTVTSRGTDDVKLHGIVRHTSPERFGVELDEESVPCAQRLLDTHARDGSTTKEATYAAAPG